jgi:hypothetical protein
MRDRIGDIVHWRLPCLLAILFSFFLVGFAPPRDPRITAIVVPDLGGEAIERAAHRQLTRRDGVVLYVALAEHRMRIEVGPESRAALSDRQALSILDQRVGPLMREGRTDDAVDAGVIAIGEALNAPPSTTRLSPAAWIACGLGICGLLLLFASLANASDRARRRGSNDVGHVPYVDAGSGGSGFSDGGGATSSW